jgi:hypothetical protein
MTRRTHDAGACPSTKPAKQAEPSLLSQGNRSASPTISAAC